MTEHHRPGLSLAEDARRIRDACPILGGYATDADCTARRELITQTLTDHSITSAPHHLWYTAQLVTGRVLGCWAHSPEEAELEISVWFGADCAWVVPDNDQRLRGEYFPPGHRTDTTRVFPVGPPRRLRDQFAPMPSLLDGLHETVAGSRGL